MTSIPNEFIDELISRVDIYDVISTRVPLKKAGKDYTGLCPFHNENTPSFTVSQNKQFYHCFGCGKNGSVIRFLMDYEGLDFIDAIKDLAQMVGIEVPVNSNNQKQLHKNLYAITEKAVRIFRHQLKEHQVVLDYLKKRSISEQTAQLFQIGYALNLWDGLMKRFHSNEHSQLLESGLTTSNDHGRVYDKFRHRLIFPIHDRRGRVIAFGGRAIDANQQPKYLNSPETPLFHKSNELYGFHLARKHSKNNYVLVVEGYMDVVALFEHGVKNAVATLGTATSEQHLKNLFKVWDNIVFCFDGDNAGRQAAAKALFTALPLYLDHQTIRFLFLPQGHDPDSYINQHGSESFQKLIDQATPLSDFLLDHLSQGVDVDSIDGRAKLFHMAQNPISQLPQGAFKQMMMQRVSQITQQQFQLAATQPQRNSVQIENSPVKKLVSLLVDQPSLHKLVPKEFKFVEFDYKGVALIDKIVEICRLCPQIGSATLIESFRDESVYDYLVPLARQYNHLDDKQKYNEFKDIITYLQKRARQSQIDSLRERQMKYGLTQQEKQQLVSLLTEHNKTKRHGN